MNTQDLIERLKRHPLPTSCAAILVICFFAFYLRMDLLSELEIENDAVQRQAQQVDQNVNAGKGLDEHIAQMDAKVGELDSRIIKHLELATNLKYFYEIEATTHVAIADLRQSMTPPAKGTPTTILTGVDYTVIITGKFREVVSYLNELEHGRHFYRLENFSLLRAQGDKTERGAGVAGPVAMSLNLELLAWP